MSEWVSENCTHEILNSEAPEIFRHNLKPRRYIFQPALRVNIGIKHPQLQDI